jgi:hypothetical protein
MMMAISLTRAVTLAFVLLTPAFAAPTEARRLIGLFLAPDHAGTPHALARFWRS